jgi:hypothetical protein
MTLESMNEDNAVTKHVSLIRHVSDNMEIVATYSKSGFGPPVASSVNLMSNTAGT